MTVKPQIYTAYSKEKTELAEKILLEVWACLGEFQKDMVLVGGLAPRYSSPERGFFQFEIIYGFFVIEDFDKEKPACRSCVIT